MSLKNPEPDGKYMAILYISNRQKLDPKKNAIKVM